MLADVFLTILYARAGSGLLINKITRATFAGFCMISKIAKANPGFLLSLCGAAVVIVLILGRKSLGFSPDIWPNLKRFERVGFKGHT